MLQNYLKIAWRNLNKSRAFSLINILGLTIGITVCMMIYLFIMHEFSVDNFHAKKSSIYRVMRSYDPSKPPTSYLSGPYAPALLNDYPHDIKKAVRVMRTEVMMSFDDKAFREKKVFAVDKNFFDLFTFPLIAGNAKTVLNDPANVVLSVNTAKKYFGSTEAALGKLLKMDKEYDVKVSGVFSDVPSNSHLEFDIVYPVTNFESQDFYKNWNNNNGFTYVELNTPASEKNLEKSFPAFMQKYMGKEMEKMNMPVNLVLTPLPEIYFENASYFDNVKHGDRRVVFIFLSVAALILLIACINFMNLSTIRAMERSKEVGLRKVMGALRNNLIWQFIGESLMLTCISCILALGLLQLVIPFYNDLLGYHLSVSWSSPLIYVFLAGVIVVAGFMAGAYPAFFLSSFSPIDSLKGKLRVGKGGSIFRQGLVVVQFAISVFLIITTFIMISQMSYMKTKQLGYNQDQTLVVPLDNGDIYNGRRSFKSEMLSNPDIRSVSFMSGEPGGFFDQHMFDVEGQKEAWKSRTLFTDEDIVRNLELKLIAGRDFSVTMKTDSAEAVIINRAAAQNLGFSPEQAIGKWIKNRMRDEQRRRIVGVVEDFNFLSLRNDMESLVISQSDDHRVALIRFSSPNITSTISRVRNIYNRVAPVYPMEYNFLDQKFELLYRGDLKQQTILSVFAGLAIFIACLGLFGLASYTATRRIKEIGVRKVLGSSVRAVVLLLSKDLLKPVFIATLIAIPLAYYAMNIWLENFAYKVSMSWVIFFLAAVITFVIALATISIKAVKAGLSNPVKSLRSE